MEYFRETWWVVSSGLYFRKQTMDSTSKNAGMKGVLEQMEKPAPKHIIDGLCHRLKLIERAEGKDGRALADECRSFISNQSKWVDVMMAAYLINGGIILRDVDLSSVAISPTSTEKSAANTPPNTDLAKKDITDEDFAEIENMVNSLGLKP